MSTVSLFRKWRSQRFQDLVGQEAVVQTLRNVLGSGSPARAYLFCGPRGTGKTSSARIFAKALNCERGPSYDPCNECSLCRQITEGSCLDVLEIDAASHTQVEKIRDFIVDKVHFSPVSARFKVYIIDEVHKLSGASFNALLKTLEEPPSHVVFILATTHPHEVLPTILSRCQRYDFRALPLARIRQHVLDVAVAEGLSLDADAANLVARAADGSLRDALVFLEQCVAYAGTSVSGEQAESILGLVGIEQMERLTLALSAGQAGQALDLLKVMAERGLDLKRLLFSFQDVLRTLLLLQAGASDTMLEQRLEHEREALERLAGNIGRGQVMAWLRLSLEMAEQAREFSDLLMLWEIYLVRMACPELDTGMEALLARVDRLERGAPVRSAGTGGGRSVDDPLERPAALLESRPVERPTERPAAPVDSVERPAVPVDRPVERPAASVEGRPVERAAAPVESRPVERPAVPVDRPVERPAAPVESRPVERAAAPVESRPVERPAASVEGQSLERLVASAEGLRTSSVEDRSIEGKLQPAARNPSPPVQGSAASISESAGLLADLSDLREIRNQLLLRAKKLDQRLHSVLVEARVVEVGEKLVLGLSEQFYQGWHGEQIKTGGPMRLALEQVARELVGRPVVVNSMPQTPQQGRSGRASEPVDEHESFVQRARRVLPGEVLPGEG